MKSYSCLKAQKIQRNGALKCRKKAHIKLLNNMKIRSLHVMTRNATCLECLMHIC
jgi:hypothetical protein